MLRFKGPGARRLQRQAARRTRWELALLALAVGHWAYHKNREWDLAVKDLVAARDAELVLEEQDGVVAIAAAPPHAIDLRSADESLRAPVPR